MIERHLQIYLSKKFISHFIHLPMLLPSMKKTINLLFACSLFAISCKQTGTNTPTSSIPTSTLDTSLIKQLGADDYGMRQYVLVFLKQGPTPVQDSIAKGKLLGEHLKYLADLMDQRKMLILGPILEENEIGGICIYESSNVEEVRALAEADPAVKAGDLMVEAHPWYSSAAIMKLPEIHARLAKKSFGDIQ